MLDLSNNRLGDGEGVLNVLKELPHLAVLNLMGNPIVQKIPYYRKTMISTLLHLTYLDDRPVFPEERRTAMAW